MQLLAFYSVHHLSGEFCASQLLKSALTNLLYEGTTVRNVAKALVWVEFVRAVLSYWKIWLLTYNFFSRWLSSFVVAVPFICGELDFAFPYQIQFVASTCSLHCWASYLVFCMQSTVGQSCAIFSNHFSVLLRQFAILKRAMSGPAFHGFCVLHLIDITSFARFFLS